MNRQDQVLAFIQSYIRDKGYAPSLNEIADNVGLLAKSNAHYYVQRLVAAGLLNQDTGVPRGISIVKPRAATTVTLYLNGANSVKCADELTQAASDIARKHDVTLVGNTTSVR